MRNKNELKLITMSEETEKDLYNFWSIFKILIVLAVADIVSTIVFLIFGYPESMLLAIKFLHAFGIMGLIFQKVIILTLIFIIAFGIYEFAKPISLGLIVLAAIGQLFIVISNIVLILIGISLIEIIGGIL